MLRTACATSLQQAQEEGYLPEHPTQAQIEAYWDEWAAAMVELAFERLDEEDDDGDAPVLVAS